MLQVEDFMMEDMVCRLILVMMLYILNFSIARVVLVMKMGLSACIDGYLSKQR